jgi:hypothetical protein
MPVIIFLPVLQETFNIFRPNVFLFVTDISGAGEEGQVQEPDARIAYPKTLSEHLCWWIWWQIDQGRQGMLTSSKIYIHMHRPLIYVNIMSWEI